MPGQPSADLTWGRTEPVPDDRPSPDPDSHGLGPTPVDASTVASRAHRHNLCCLPGLWPREERVGSGLPHPRWLQLEVRPSRGQRPVAQDDRLVPTTLSLEFT